MNQCASRNNLLYAACSTSFVGERWVWQGWGSISFWAIRIPIRIVIVLPSKAGLPACSICPYLNPIKGYPLFRIYTRLDLAIYIYGIHTACPYIISFAIYIYGLAFVFLLTQLTNTSPPYSFPSLQLRSGSNKNVLVPNNCTCRRNFLVVYTNGFWIRIIKRTVNLYW